MTAPLTVTAIRQTRPDHFVEVRIAGRWHLAYDCVWPWTHTTGRAVVVGDRAVSLAR